MTVVAVVEDGAAPPHDAVEPARDAHAEPLHAAGERALVLRLDEQVQVVPRHGIVHEAKAEAVAAAPEGARQRREAATGPQIPHAAAHAPGGVNGMAGGERRPSEVRHTRDPPPVLARPPGAGASPA